MDEDDEEKLAAIAAEIRRYRLEWADSIRQGIEAEVAQMEADRFDPARGRGRGPRWADGIGCYSSRARDAKFPLGSPFAREVC